MLDIFRITDSKELTDDLLMKYIRMNDSKTNTRYKPLWNAYQNDYPIYHQKDKPSWRPDWRASVNFARYIVDTFEGFFLGVPLKISSEDETVQEYIDELEAMTDGEDLNAELSSIVSIFGRGYRLTFVDEDGEIGSAYLDPMEAFAIYNESITPKMRYFVRTYTDSDKVKRGSISDESTVRYFKLEGGSVVWEEEHAHGFDGVPAVEFIQNRARRGIFEDCLPMINAMNKTLSEKINDVDYYADTYLKVLGARLDEQAIKFMRESRVVNFAGKDGQSVIVEFMQKPSGDTTQEHLLDRIERLIFEIAMVCNISDNTFATSSGIALKWKMTPMINLAANKWRKFHHGLNVYYKLVCSNPVTPLEKDDWTKLDILHQLNYPANIAEEASIAQTLSGVTSRETQLKVLPDVVDDVQAEMERIKKEQEEAMELATQYELERTAQEQALNKGAESGAEGEFTDQEGNQVIKM